MPWIKKAKYLISLKSGAHESQWNKNLWMQYSAKLQSRYPIQNKINTLK